MGIRETLSCTPLFFFTLFLPTHLNGGTHRYLSKYVSLREGGFKFYLSKGSTVLGVHLGGEVFDSLVPKYGRSGKNIQINLEDKQWLSNLEYGTTYCSICL